MIRAFGLALMFLTRIPVPVRFEPRPEDWGRSVAFFPVVGLVIGLILAGLCLALPRTDPGVVAALLLAVWALATGGLHLDGLADTADAWVGGYGSRERTLAIMKDPRSGPAAVMVTALVLIAKFAALTAVVERAAWGLLLLVPVLGRAALLLMLVTTPYVRPQGVGVAHAEHLPGGVCLLLLLSVAAVTVWALGWGGVTLLALLGIGFLSLRRLLLGRIGGTTGDTLGATCELAEAAALVILVLLAGR